MLRCPSHPGPLPGQPHLRTAAGRATRVRPPPFVVDGPQRLTGRSRRGDEAPREESASSLGASRLPFHGPTFLLPVQADTNLRLNRYNRSASMQINA